MVRIDVPIHESGKHTDLMSIKSSSVNAIDGPATNP